MKDKKQRSHIHSVDGYLYGDVTGTSGNGEIFLARVGDVIVGRGKLQFTSKTFRKIVRHGPRHAGKVTLCIWLLVHVVVRLGCFFLLFFHVYRNLTDFYQQLIEIPTWTETVKR